MPRPKTAPQLLPGEELPVPTEETDEMGRTRLQVRPNKRVYNGVFKAPHGATGAQRDALVGEYVKAYGNPRGERGFLPLENYADNPPIAKDEAFRARM